MYGNKEHSVSITTIAGFNHYTILAKGNLQQHSNVNAQATQVNANLVDQKDLAKMTNEVSVKLAVSVWLAVRKASNLAMLTITTTQPYPIV